MAIDAVIDSTIEIACRTAEANAIRAKTGGSSQIAYDWANSKGFSDAIAAIPTGTTPTGTKQISITQNGTTTEDVTAYASAEISVNVAELDISDTEQDFAIKYALVTIGENNIADTLDLREYLTAMAVPSGGQLLFFAIKDAPTPYNNLIYGSVVATSYPPNLVYRYRSGAIQSVNSTQHGYDTVVSTGMQYYVCWIEGVAVSV